MHSGGKGLRRARRSGLMASGIALLSFRKGDTFKITPMFFRSPGHLRHSGRGIKKEAGQGRHAGKKSFRSARVRACGRELPSCKFLGMMSREDAEEFTQNLGQTFAGS